MTCTGQLGLEVARPMRWRALALACSCLALAACSSPNPVKAADAEGADANASADAPDLKVAPDISTKIPPGCDCAPGTTVGCAQPTYVQRCAADCHTLIAEQCLDDEGSETACVNPGRCLACPAGKNRCDPNNSIARQSCSADGEWVQAELCKADEGAACFGGSCQKACEFNVKAKSYLGCAFWATDLDNAFVPGGSQTSYFDAANAQYAIVVSNPSDKLSAKVTISSNEGEQLLDSHGDDLDTSALAPGELRVFNLPPRNIDQTSIEPQAWRVTSTVPIAAYQFNPLENVGVYSNDASLLLPDEVLGKYYIAMSREQSFTILRGFLTIVGTIAGGTTHVTVTFSSTTGRTLASADGKIKSYKSGESATFELSRWDALNIETDVVGGDLTGTVVVADKRVAVFAGSEAANAPNTNHCDVDQCTDKDFQKGTKCGVCEWDHKTPCNNNEHCIQFITCCADHLEMQMLPVKTWDSRYVAVKLFPRNQELDVWRIVAATDGTKVALNPPQKDEKGKTINIPVLDTGEWYEFSPRRADSGSGPYTPNQKPAAGDCNFEIVAKHDDGTPAAIMVGHFMASQDAPNPGQQPYDGGTGDPAFLLAIPVAQWRDQYVFLTPTKYSINYISIAAPIAKPGEPEVEVTFDDQPIAPDQWTNITKDFKFARLFVDSGPHTVTVKPWKDTGGEVHTRQIAVDAYGFDQYVSYGYPAGLDLKDVNLVKEPGDE